MWAIKGHYSPAILWGKQALKSSDFFMPVCGYYRLLAVQDGFHTISVAGIDQVIGPGQAYLNIPPQNLQLRRSPGSIAYVIAFTVTSCDLVFTGDGGSLRTADGAHLEPPPSHIWGVDLPTVPDPAWQHKWREVLPKLCNDWWRSPLLHFHANSVLAEVLHSWVLYHSEQQVGNEAVSLHDNLIAHVERIMLRDMAVLKTIKDIADRVGLSRDHLTRVYKQAVSKTPIEKLKELRLQQAMELVRDTDTSIAAIAEQVGYSTAAVFQAAWSKRFDLSPLKWRRKQRLEK